MTTPLDIRAAVLDALTEVAPEVDPAGLDAASSIRDQVELDSMDFLFFLTALAERTGVEIAEADYGQVQTIDDCVAFIAGAHHEAPASPDHPQGAAP